MKTTEILQASLLATIFLAGCTNLEAPVVADSGEAIRITAGIEQTTRAVIDASYANNLDVSFARIDHSTADADWSSPAIDAVRTGGAGKTSISFNPEQNYLSGNVRSTLIGYYPRKALENNTSNPVAVKYEITGAEDIMATEVQTGALDQKFTSLTFQHLLTQLQFKCIGSAEAVAQWTGVTSIKVSNAYTALTLSLDKTDGAKLTATGTANQTLTAKNCPDAVSVATGLNPPTGYLMLFPATNMGTEAAAINLEVTATYKERVRTQALAINNISNGVKAGQSHLITLTFTEDGKILAEAGIAEWVSGNGGSVVVTPGE